MMHTGKTQELILLIGSPYEEVTRSIPSSETLLDFYEIAFRNRVAALLLHRYRDKSWHPELERRYLDLRTRQEMTLTVLSDLAVNLHQLNPEGYVVFKSIKPYPAIPNDTDALIFGDKKEFDAALAHLYSLGYIFHEWAPMQTTLYDSRGIGKIGKGKKGGIYYIDIYQDISTDYVCYLNKNSVHPYVYCSEIQGKQVRLLRPEPELAIILFHNMFPERTYQLEHFYMPLYYFAKHDFDLDVFVKFVDENHLDFAVKTNLSLIETLHQQCFGFVPEKVTQLLAYWKRNNYEALRFSSRKMKTPYMFSSKAFWTTFVRKLRDFAFLKSLGLQLVHMLNPIFFWDVIMSLKNRFGEYGTYHAE